MQDQGLCNLLRYTTEIASRIPQGALRVARELLTFQLVKPPSTLSMGRSAIVTTASLPSRPIVNSCKDKVQWVEVPGVVTGPEMPVKSCAKSSTMHAFAATAPPAKADV